MQPLKDKYITWKDFASSVPVDLLINDFDDDKVRYDKFRSLMLKLQNVNGGMPWLPPDKSTVDSYPWLQDLHLTYIESDMAAEDFYEHEYKLCSQEIPEEDNNL